MTFKTLDEMLEGNLSTPAIDTLTPPPASEEDLPPVEQDSPPGNQPNPPIEVQEDVDPSSPQVIPPVEAPATPPENDFDSKVRAFQVAAEDERKKRQGIERALEDQRTQANEYQRRLAELEGRLKGAGLLDDPSNKQPDYDLYDPAQLQTFIQSQFEQQQLQIQTAAINQRISQSAALAEMRHPDYKEMEQIFADAAQKNPALWQVIYSDHVRDPAEEAYQYAKRLQQSQAPAIDEASLRERLRQEIMQEMAQASPAPNQSPAVAPQAEAPPPPPRTLANAGGGQTSAPNVFAGQQPISEILENAQERMRNGN